MNFQVSHLIFAALIFVWTPSCNGTTTQKESTSGSSFFFYQHSTYPRDCQEVQDQCHNSTGVFMIKPDAYPEPFEVYCDSTDSSSGWTVIQRRLDNSIGFRRDWGSYKSGFGFLSQEFWLGNERVSFLTNQKKYQLMIEMRTFNDSIISLVYDNFRISDAFTNYKLVSVGQYSGLTDGITFCRNNTLFGNCIDACERTCEAPGNCQAIMCTETFACVCPDGFFRQGSECVPREDCGCYEEDEGTIIPEGESYVNPSCSRKGVCMNGQIIWDEGYACSTNAMCKMTDGVRQCYCNEGYTGDGQTCTKDDTGHRDCQDIYDHVSTDSGVYEIMPINWTGPPFEVYCNMTDGGGWTVFQRRVNGSENFYRGWDSYKEGFGDLNHEFWLGNDKIHFLTHQKRYEIRVDLVNLDENFYYANFDYFLINDESDNFRLSQLGSYTGTADERSNPDGYSLRYHLGYEFSTFDMDNDDWDYSLYESNDNNCAINWRGAWWYNDCARSNLNGEYGHDKFHWWYLPGSHDVQFTQMKVRPL